MAGNKKFSRKGAIHWLGASALISGGVGLTALVQQWLDIEIATFPILIGAIFLCALVFSFTPSIFAVGLGTLESRYYLFTTPHGAHFAEARGGIILLALFFSVSSFIVWQTHRIRHPRPQRMDLESRRAQQRFRRLYESNLIGIVFYEVDGCLSDSNDALLDTLGYTRAEYEEQPLNWEDLIAPEGKALDSQQSAVLLKMGRCGPAENELLRQDGKKVPVLISRADLAPGEHDEGVAFIVDLSRIKDAEDALRRTEGALRQANDSLEYRVRDRTAALETQSERLRALALDLAETESRERKRLAQILHDHFQQLLSAAKMKIGIIRRRSPGHPEVDSLKETERLLEEAINASRSLATELSPPVLHDTGLGAAFEWLARRMEQNHQLKVDVNLNAWREPDNEQIRTILFECVRELFSNIVKHAGVNTAQLSATLVNEGLLQIRVTDQGKGFDALSTHLQRRPDGSFGLFSIRERLGLIGGLVKVTSKPGQGTTVELSLPMIVKPLIEPLAAPRELATPATASPDANRTVRVLVADDHKLFREGLISLLIQEPNLRIVGEAGDGQEAVDLARQLRPDIMIVDVTMPRLNGVQVASIISREMPQVKIIGLSMHERDDMANAMYSAGAIAYCAKSAPIESLVNILRNTAASTTALPPTSAQ